MSKGCDETLLRVILCTLQEINNYERSTTTKTCDLRDTPTHYRGTKGERGSLQNPDKLKRPKKYNETFPKTVGKVPHAKIINIESLSGTFHCAAAESNGIRIGISSMSSGSGLLTLTHTSKCRRRGAINIVDR